MFSVVFKAETKNSYIILYVLQDNYFMFCGVLMVYSWWQFLFDIIIFNYDKDDKCKKLQYKLGSKR